MYIDIQKTRVVYNLVGPNRLTVKTSVLYDLVGQHSFPENLCR